MDDRCLRWFVVWGVKEEVWGVLKWCNFWMFMGVSLIWFVVIVKWFGVIYG